MSDTADGVTGGLERIYLRSPIVALGLGQLDGVQRQHLRTSDARESGTMISFEPTATRLQRIMLTAAAVHYLS